MLTQKLFNTQLGGEDRIHNLESLTGFSTAGEKCKQAHQCNYCVTTCENKHPSARAESSALGTENAL